MNEFILKKKHVACVAFASLQLGQNILKQLSRINVENELWMLIVTNSINPSLCLHLLLHPSQDLVVAFVLVLNGCFLHNSTKQ